METFEWGTLEILRSSSCQLPWSHVQRMGEWAQGRITSRGFTPSEWVCWWFQHTANAKLNIYISRRRCPWDLIILNPDATLALCSGRFPLLWKHLIYNVVHMWKEKSGETPDASVRHLLASVSETGHVVFDSGARRRLSEPGRRKTNLTPSKVKKYASLNLKAH